MGKGPSGRVPWDQGWDRAAGGKKPQHRESTDAIRGPEETQRETGWTVPQTANLVLTHLSMHYVEKLSQPLKSRAISQGSAVHRIMGPAGGLG